MWSPARPISATASSATPCSRTAPWITAVGLEEVRHDAPSTIGLDTLLRSRGALPQSFILGSGVPVAVVGLQDSVADAPVTTLEVHISCADADVPFARQLEANLRAQGVRTWVFAEGFRGNPLVDRRATSGEEEIERWVRHYDRLDCGVHRGRFRQRDRPQRHHRRPRSTANRR